MSSVFVVLTIIYYACIGCDEYGFFRLPTQEDLRDYDIMEAFVDTLSGAAQERLAIAISGRGAFRRFKDEVRRLGLEAQWYAWHDDAYRRKAIEWCEENGIDTNLNLNVCKHASGFFVIPRRRPAGLLATRS